MNKQLAQVYLLEYTKVMDIPVKKGILLTAFGTGTHSGQQGLREFEQLVNQAFPGIPVRWAFSSGIMRERLAEKRHKTDSVRKALEKMAFERFTHVAVQSLHTIAGTDWHALDAQVRTVLAEKRLVRIESGLPLLNDASDCAKAADAILRHIPQERKAGEPCILMGHGSRHEGDAAYHKLAELLAHRDKALFFASLEGGRNVCRRNSTMGRQEAQQGSTVPVHPLDAVFPRLQNYLQTSAQPTPPGPQGQRIWLLPFLALVGQHVHRDMAGPGPQSWKSQIEARGYACCPVYKGLVEYEAFSALWVEHLRAAFRRLGDDPPHHAV